METSLHIFGHLLGGFEVHFVDSVFVELAIRRSVVTTDLRSCVVDATSVVRLQMFAVRVNQQIPSTILNKNRRSIVQKIPTDKVQILLTRGGVDWQSEVTTTFSGAVFAKRGSFWNLFSSGLFAIDRFRGQKLNWLWKCCCAHTTSLNQLSSKNKWRSPNACTQLRASIC